MRQQGHEQQLDQGDSWCDRRGNVHRHGDAIQLECHFASICRLDDATASNEEGLVVRASSSSSAAAAAAAAAAWITWIAWIGSRQLSSGRRGKFETVKQKNRCEFVSVIITKRGGNDISNIFSIFQNGQEPMSLFLAPSDAVVNSVCALADDGDDDADDDSMDT